MSARLFKSILLSFSAGCLGGLICSLAIWLSGATELTAHFKVKIAPALTTQWLYPKILWGGLWGQLFLLPFYRRSYFFRSLLYSLAPTFVQLFIILPFIENQGFMGTRLGDFTPLAILSFNLVWGITTGLSLQITER